MRERSMKPAPYPPNSTEELEAITTFEGLLDKRFVMPHLNKFDKVPNTDGHIEIVDEERRPLGKLEVQVRKIPDGETSYSCPVQLVAYSQTISLPFLLVCVDVGSRKAYFRHLDRSMPELKPDQQTFTVRFDPKVQAVSRETGYLRQWLEIIADYNKRVADCPKLREIVSQLDLSHISRCDRIYFHQLIDRVNRLLDLEFPIVKERFFSGVWKLGVQVSSADATQVGFHLYAVGTDDPAILVSGAPPAEALQSSATSEAPGDSAGQTPVAFTLQGAWPKQKEVQFNWRNRSFLKSPEEEGDRFVFNYLKTMLHTKSLPLYGSRLAVEYLFWFVDRFGRSLGVQPSDRLKVADLDYGIHVYLPAWGSLAVPRFLGELIRLNRHNPSVVAPAILAPPFEHVANVYPDKLSPTKEEVVRLIESGRDLTPTRVSFSEASPHLFVQAVDYLTSLNEEWIERPYKPRSWHSPWVSCGYSAEALRHNIPGILIHSVDEYRVFVERNRIPLRKSFYLQQSEAVVYAADFPQWSTATHLENSPILQTYTVRNEDLKLPKVTLVDLSQEPAELIVHKHALTLRGVERELVTRGPEHPFELFKDLPMLNRVYDMLREDLRNEFNHDFS
jgi:hypothetical protein